MKITFTLTVCCLLLVALVFFVFIIYLDNKPGSHDGQNGDAAFIIWGTLDYANETFMGGKPELSASKDVCEANP